jgi:hypothetical protein
LKRGGPLLSVYGALPLIRTPAACPLAHDAGPAGEAVLHEFAPQQGCVAASLCPAPLEVVAIWREDAGAQPTPDGVALRTEQIGDALDRNTRRMQPRGLFVAPLAPRVGDLPAPLGSSWFTTVRHRDRTFRGRHVVLVAELSADPSDGGVLAVDNGTDGIAKVAQQMPPIGYLDRFRRALPYAIGIGAGPVARDDLDPGVLAKPFGQARSLPVGQEVDHRVALQVDQHRAVAVTAAPGPVINRKNARGRPWIRAGTGERLANQPQQRIRAGRHGQTFR